MTNIFIIAVLIILFLFILIKIVKLDTLFKKEKFSNVSKCHGKRDGVSGCRTCCSSIYPSKYSQCINECM